MHSIQVRTPDLRFDEAMPVLWFGGNAFLTFLFDGFNLTFPEGERFFVRAVHDHLGQVTDPDLRAQARAFSGQEGQHARIHERLFGALRAQGFDLAPFFARYDTYSRRVAKSPDALRLSVTAALEHYTATLAQIVFLPHFLDGVHEPMRKLLVWHAAEEMEHRAVAFDVLRATRPGYLLRVLGFFLGTCSVLYWIILGMRLFVAQSHTTRQTMRADGRRALAALGGFPLFRLLIAYLRPGFHPNDGGPLDVALAQLRAEGLDAAA
jgi:predicted metal-dependent hydrolase